MKYLYIPVTYAHPVGNTWQYSERTLLKYELRIGNANNSQQTTATAKYRTYFILELNNIISLNYT